MSAVVRGAPGRVQHVDVVVNGNNRHGPEILVPVRDTATGLVTNRTFVVTHISTLDANGVVTGKLDLSPAQLAQMVQTMRGALPTVNGNYANMNKITIGMERGKAQMSETERYSFKNAHVHSLGGAAQPLAVALTPQRNALESVVNTAFANLRFNRAERMGRAQPPAGAGVHRGPHYAQLPPNNGAGGAAAASAASTARGRGRGAGHPAGRGGRGSIAHRRGAGRHMAPPRSPAASSATAGASAGSGVHISPYNSDDDNDDS